MLSTKSAVQRVLDVPEILLLVFLELDNPGDFGRVNRRFRETSTDYINIARHFEQRYYPFEIMSELLMRVNVHRERLDLFALFLGRGGLLSRYFLVALHQHPSHLTRLDPNQNLTLRIGHLHGENSTTTIGYKLFKFLKQKSTFLPLQRLGSGRDYDRLVQLLQTQEHRGTSISRHREEFAKVLKRYGFPGWSSKQSHLKIVYQSILLYCARDLDWHFHFLDKEVGCPTLHDWSVFNLVMRDCLIAGNILPIETVKWLYANFGLQWWRWACAAILDPIRPTGPIVRITLHDLVLEAAADLEAMTRLAIHTLSQHTPARLEYTKNQEQYASIWERHLSKVKRYPNGLEHLRPGIDASMLYLALAGEESLKHVKTDSRKALAHQLYPASAVRLLSAPFHTLESFTEAMFFVSDKLKKKHKLDGVLEETLDSLLGIHTSGLQVLTLAERYTWVVPRIIDLLTPANVHLVLEDAPIVETVPIDNIALAVKKHFTSQSQNSPGWLKQTPDKGCVPLALALLSLLRKHGTADAKITLELIYMEAKRRNKEKIVAAYETVGFGRERPPQPSPPASYAARKRKRGIRR